VPVDYRGEFPGTYFRLVQDGAAKYGHKPVGWDSWGSLQASRYVRKLQSRRSLLTWKVYGRRTDGFANDDLPSEDPSGSGKLTWHGQPVEMEQNRHLADLDYTGNPMPPPDAVAGTYDGADGQKIKVEPLTDADRRTLVRWIDLGCPIDLDYDPERPDARGYGWMCDDNRPTLTLTYPRPGSNGPLERILVGMHDYYSGFDPASFRVTADFSMNGLAAGEDLAGLFQPKSQGVWEISLSQPLAVPEGLLTVSVHDRQGNESRIERRFSAALD
jgi:hypothetical protein